MTLLLKPTKFPVCHGRVIFSHSNMETPGSRISANFALAVINRSLQTINSHFLVSFRISAVLLISLCWLISVFPARFRIILISLERCRFSGSSAFGEGFSPSISIPGSLPAIFPQETPSSPFISCPRSTASVHRNTGIFIGYGFSGMGNTGSA